MSSTPNSETTSLFALWKANRNGLPAYGECCRMVRAGEVPGSFSTNTGSLVVMADRSADALGAMRKGA